MRGPSYSGLLLSVDSAFSKIFDVEVKRAFLYKNFRRGNVKSLTLIDNIRKISGVSFSAKLVVCIFWIFPSGKIFQLGPRRGIQKNYLTANLRSKIAKKIFRFVLPTTFVGNLTMFIGKFSLKSHDLKAKIFKIVVLLFLCC